MSSLKGLWSEWMQNIHSNPSHTTWEMRSMTNSSRSEDLTFSKQKPRRKIPWNATILGTTSTGTSKSGKKKKSYRLILRKPLIRSLGWQPGLAIRQIEVNGKILLEPIKET